MKPLGSFFMWILTRYESFALEIGKILDLLDNPNFDRFRVPTVSCVMRPLPWWKKLLGIAGLAVYLVFDWEVFGD